MKNKIFILMFLLLFGVMSVWTQDTKNIATIEKHTLKEFNTEYEGLLKIDKETRKIRINFDENIIAKSKEPLEIITQLVNEKGDKYCLDKIENIRITSIIKTPVDRCIYFEQLLNNIPVYATEGSVSVSDNDNVINYVLANFRDVSKYKDVVKEPALSLSSEEALATANMQDAAYAIIKADEQLYNKAHYCKILQHFYNARLMDHNYPGFLGYLNNWTIDLPHTISGCHVYIYDVMLWPKGKLTVNAETSVTIDAPFEVQDGAELEINILQ